MCHAWCIVSLNHMPIMYVLVNTQAQLADPGAIIQRRKSDMCNHRGPCTRSRAVLYVGHNPLFGPLGLCRSIEEGYTAAIEEYRDPAQAMQHLLSGMYSSLQV